MAEGTKLALKLQLVTAQRKGEVVSAAWEEVDLVEGWWTIPGHTSKNALPHRVPLSPLAIEPFQAANVFSGDSPWIFPSPQGNQHITPKAVDHALRRPGLETLGFSFVPHDLRRTAVSNIASLGFGALVGKVLNHKERGVTAVYDRHSYDQEKRQALEAWGRRLKARSCLLPPAARECRRAKRQGGRCYSVLIFSSAALCSFLGSPWAGFLPMSQAGFIGYSFGSKMTQ